MTEKIPFFNEFDSFEQEIVLEDSVYNLKFNYNSRGDFWTMSVRAPDLTVLVGGVKVVLNYELINQWLPGREIPPGEIFTVDTTDGELRINRDNLGLVANLFYIPEGE